MANVYHIMWCSARTAGIFVEPLGVDGRDVALERLHDLLALRQAGPIANCVIYGIWKTRGTAGASWA